VCNISTKCTLLLYRILHIQYAILYVRYGAQYVRHGILHVHYGTPACSSTTPCRSCHPQYDMIAQIKPTQRWMRLLTSRQYCFWHACIQISEALIQATVKAGCGSITIDIKRAAGKGTCSPVMSLIWEPSPSALHCPPS